MLQSMGLGSVVVVVRVVVEGVAVAVGVRDWKYSGVKSCGMEFLRLSSMADCSGVRIGSLGVVFLDGEAEFLDGEAP